MRRSANYERVNDRLCHTVCTPHHMHRSTCPRLKPRRAEGRLTLPPPPYRERLGILLPTASAIYHQWLYNKTENLTPADIAYSPAFTHVIAESRDALLAGRWEIVDVRMSYMGSKGGRCTVMYWGL